MTVVPSSSGAAIATTSAKRLTLVATILGLHGWPAAAEASAVARDLAVLADVLVDEPRARLHLTHLSTAAALERVKA